MMMSEDPVCLVVDADVFIAAKNQYYSFDICPGFWKSLVYHGNRGSVCSIDKVRNELLAGTRTEDLVNWVKNDLSIDFFADTTVEAVTSAYEDVILWVQQNSQYYSNAKSKFATEADGWLVAFAMVTGAIVVTNEQPRPDSKSRILLPDVCTRFDVVYKDAFFMLEHLKVQFDWEAAE